MNSLPWEVRCETAYIPAGRDGKDSEGFVCCYHTCRQQFRSSLPRSLISALRYKHLGNDQVTATATPGSYMVGTKPIHLRGSLNFSMTEQRRGLGTSPPPSQCETHSLTGENSPPPCPTLNLILLPSIPFFLLFHSRVHALNYLCC